MKAFVAPAPLKVGDWTHGFRWTGSVLALALIYCLSGKLGLLMAIPPGVATPVWPPSGISLAAVMLLGSRIWPGIFLGSFALNLSIIADDPGIEAWLAALVASGIAIGSSAQPLVGARLLRWLVGTQSPLGRPRDVFGFAGIAGLLGCTISASVGVTSVCLGEVADWSEFGVNWTTWWLGDVAGVLILTPLLLSWNSRAARGRPHRWLELAMCFALALTVASMVFSAPVESVFSARSLAFLLIPFLLWAALRFGPQEAMSVLLVIGGIAVFGTVRHMGPFARESLNESRLLLEMFLAVSALTALFVGAAVTERSTSEARLREANLELEERVRDRTADLVQTNQALTAEIGDRKQVEAVLRDREARLRLFVEQAPAVLWSVDATLRITSAVGTGLVALGLDASELVGKSLSDDPDSEHSAFPGIEFHRRALRGAAVKFEQRWRDRDFQAQIEPLRDELGRITGCVGVAFDITERKRAESERLGMERQLQETQKLESLGVLAGGIAHDFNNLLTGVLGNASLASMGLSPSSPAQAHLRRIESAAERAAELCKQMLAYSGRGQFLVQKVCMNALITETTDLLTLSISKKAELRLQLAENLPAVEADVTPMRQVLMNLIINASEALGENAGTIEVGTAVQHLDQAFLAATRHSSEAVAGNFVVLSVRDTGVGMTREEMNRIFDPFFTTKRTGRGLGLSAVLGIVRGHRGALDVESEVGRGTTLRVFLPSVVGDATALERAGGSEQDWRGQGSVLLVDDEEIVRSVAASMLESFGFDVVLASNGAEAVARFRQEADRFVAVLLDFTMPQMGGVEAMREIRLARPGARVILMSGFNERDATRDLDADGQVVFLQKPFRPADLRNKLRALLEGVDELRGQGHAPSSGE